VTIIDKAEKRNLQRYMEGISSVRRDRIEDERIYVCRARNVWDRSRSPKNFTS
jgi:hypothetical protein